MEIKMLKTAAGNIPVQDQMYSTHTTDLNAINILSVVH
jgi:hypothetical protein